MSLIAIYNPVCGNGDAKAFFEQHVLPLLVQHGKVLGALVATDHAGHAGEVLANFNSGQVPGTTTVILGSGDGTLHEIINWLFPINRMEQTFDAFARELHFVLVPCGTANALYSSLYPPSPQDDSVQYRLQSVKSFIHSSHVVPLTLAMATISCPHKKKLPRLLISSVVLSTALHANILSSSEKMRKEMPGIDRFKVAARDNSTRWYNSHVKLLPMHRAGRVQVYDPDREAFIDHPESNELDPVINIEGPFVYFLSTVNVDRLEPAFRIAPLVKTIPRSEISCDLVLLRPLRDPSSNAGTNMSFVPKLWALLGAAYEDGAHVNLRYDGEGQITRTGNGPTVVEYFRCGGWEWIPEDNDEPAHLLCSDGAIVQIEKGGQATCSMVAEDLRFMVYGLE